jgi:autophagy-related protein 5
MAYSSSEVPQTLWAAEIPVYITYVNSDPADPDSTTRYSLPFVTTIPRFSYLALLLPRLATFFGAPCSSFHHEDVLLRNLAVGLLVDLYQPDLPWRLTVSDGVAWDIGDTFLNCVKEVCLFFSTFPNRVGLRYLFRPVLVCTYGDVMGGWGGRSRLIMYPRPHS